MVIVASIAGAGPHLCPPCARRAGPAGRRLADYATAELRANLPTPPPPRPGSGTSKGGGMRWHPTNPAQPWHGYYG